MQGPNGQGYVGSWAEKGVTNRGCSIPLPVYPPVPRLMQRTAMVWKVPLLVELIVLGTHLWTIDKEFVGITKDLHYFVASVEFAGQQPRREHI